MIQFKPGQIIDGWGSDLYRPAVVVQDMPELLRIDVLLLNSDHRYSKPWSWYVPSNSRSNIKVLNKNEVLLRESYTNKV